MVKVKVRDKKRVGSITMFWKGLLVLKNVRLRPRSQEGNLYTTPGQRWHEIE